MSLPLELDPEPVLVVPFGIGMGDAPTPGDGLVVDLASGGCKPVVPFVMGWPVDPEVPTGPDEPVIPLLPGLLIPAGLPVRGDED